jgi:hypothetical protein
MELIGKGAVGAAASFVLMYDPQAAEPLDVWVPALLHALSLLKALCAHQPARGGLAELLQKEDSLPRALVAIKSSVNR